MSTEAVMAVPAPEDESKLSPVEDVEAAKQPAMEIRGPSCLRWHIGKLSVPVKKNASLSVANLEVPGSWRSDDAPPPEKGPAVRDILDGVVGQAAKGEMWALMGASGAGKTSLLDCISLRNHKFDGQVFLDDRPVDQSFFSTTGKLSNLSYHP